MDSKHLIQSPMTPREITQELDNHIIGQDKAKRAVAIALRNRWRRQQLEGLLAFAKENSDRLVEALQADMGKPELEARAADCVP